MPLMTVHALSACALVGLLCATSACTQEPARLSVALGMPDSVARPLLNELAGDKKIAIDVRRAGDDAADLLWERDPEVVLQLAARGGLATLPGHGDYGRSPSMIDPARRWVATSAVARALVYDPSRIADADAPTRLQQLTQPETASQLVLADPTRGAASWQAAALFAVLGETRALEFYRDVRARGAQTVADEDAVIAALLAGQRPLALTDSDRALAAQERQPNLVVTIPDQDADGIGALVLPAVVAVSAHGAANPSVSALLDVLLAAPATRRIALTTNSLLVLEDPAELPPGLLSIRGLHLMPVSYADLAARLPAVRATLSHLATPA
jgi:iron(III) transport system substrate-binding protein